MNRTGIPLWAAVVGLLGSALLPMGNVHADGTVTQTIGVKNLRHEAWEPVEGQLMVGIVTDFGPWFGSVYPMVSLQVSADVEKDEGSNAELTSGVSELTAGLRWREDTGRFRPYLGIGVSYVDASLELEVSGFSVSVEDESVGYTGNAGALIELGGGVQLGLDLRYTGGTSISFFDDFEMDADSYSAGVLIGWGWGADPSPRGAPPVMKLEVPAPVRAEPGPQYAQASSASGAPAPAVTTSASATPAVLPPAAPVAPALAEGQSVTLISDAVVHGRPVPGDGAVTTLPAGTPVQLVRAMKNASGEWWYVKAGARAGWVRSVELVQGARS